MTSGAGGRRFGWSGMSRAISLTIALTSAFWVAFGAWLFHNHVVGSHGGSRQTPSQQTGSVTRGKGLLSGLVAGPVRQTDPRAPALAGGQLAIPVVGVSPASLTDTFTQARAQGARRHDAIDIMAAEGTPVIAAAPGRVEKLFLSHDGGNTIYIRSPSGRLIYYYAHLASYEPSLREGMTVRRGQRLGSVGHTGNASAEGPHLHFTVWSVDPAKSWSQDAPAINPYPLLKSAAAGSKASD